MKKNILLLVLLLTVFLALPTACNAEEAPTMKWEEISLDIGDFIRHASLYNINNNLLVVHNTGSGEEYQYIRLYNSNGEKKWEYKQEYYNNPYFIINNDYLALANYTRSANEKSSITLLNIKDGTVYKNIDVSEIYNNINEHAYCNYAYYYNNKIVLLFTYFFNEKRKHTYYLYTVDLDGNIESLKTAPFELVKKK